MRVLTRSDLIRAAGKRAAAIALGLLLLTFVRAYARELTYSIGDKAVTVTGFSGEATSVSIPSTIDSKPVTAIGDYAFSGQKKLTSVEFPGSVTSIGKNAFADCTALTRVTFPSSLTTLGEGAFRRSGLTSVTVPGNVTTINSFAFAECASLKSAALSEGVTNLGNEIFFADTALERVMIPASVKKIGLNIMGACPRAYALTPSGAGILSSLRTQKIPCGASDSQFLWENVESGAYILRYVKDGGAVTVPDTINGLTVTGIETGAFAGSAVTSVTLPATVKVISDGAFENCASLTRVTFTGNGANLTAIGDRAFANCPQLTLVSLPSGLTSLGKEAFRGCSALNVSLPDNLAVMGEGAFRECASLKEIKLPSRLTGISKNLFRDCAGLASVHLGSVRYFGGSYAFAGCGNLTTVTFSQSMEAVPDYAFYNCAKLARVEIPESVTRVGSNAFALCPALTYASLPTGLTSLGDNAFRGCTALGSLYIPISTTSIGKTVAETKTVIMSFPGATARKYAADNGYTWQEPFEYTKRGSEVTITAFLGRASTVEIPASIGGYAVTDVDGQKFSSYTFITAYSVASGSSLKAVDGVLYSGDGATCLCVPSGYPQATCRLAAGVTTVRSYAAYGCTTANSVHLPASFRTAEANAFKKGMILYGETETARSYAAGAGYEYRAAVTKVTLTVEGLSNGSISAKYRTVQLSASVEPADAYTTTCLFTSSNSDILSIENGKATLRRPGAVTVKAISVNGVEDSKTINVWPDYVQETAITLDASTLNMAVNSECYLGLGTVAPENASVRELTWTSSNTEILTVTASGETTRLKSGAKTGTVTVTGKSMNGYTATCKVVVKKASPYLTSSSVTVRGGGGTAKVNVKFNPTINRALAQWTSDDPQIATVREDGTVTGVAAGKTKVRATIAGKTLVCAVTVNQQVTGISLTGSPGLGSQKSITLKCAVSPSNAKNKTVTYAISDKSLASVSSTGTVTSKKKVTSPVAVTVTATAKDGSGVSASFTVTIYPVVTGVKIRHSGPASSGTYVLEVGGSLALSAACAPDNAYQGVNWKSSAPSVASVDENGVVRALKKGSASVTATARDGSGKSATFKIQVGVKVKGIALSGKDSLCGGASAKLTPTVTPKEASIKGVTYTSSNTDALKVSADGKMTARAVNSAVEVTVTATAKDGSGVYDVKKVTVYPAAKKITVTQDGQEVSKTITLDLTRGGVSNLKATIEPAAAYQGVTWSSSYAPVAAVDKDTGVITGKKPGTATLTVKAQDGSGKSATYTIKVVRRASALSISGKEELAAGKSMTLKASFEPANVTSKALAYTSSNTNAATVSGSGVVTAKKVSEAAKVIITATCKDGSGVAAQWTFTVRPLVSGITVYRDGAAVDKSVTLDLNQGSTLQLTASAQPASASQNITWASSNTSVFNVDKQSGMITAKKPGTANVVAKATDGSGKTTVIKVSVVRRATGLTLTGSDTLASGKSTTLKAAFTPANVTSKGLNYTSSNTDAATVTNTGVVTAKKVTEPVQVTITAACKDGSGVTARFNMTIRPVTTGCAIMVGGEKTAKVSIGLSERAQLSYAAKPDGAWQSAKWKSSNPSVATVDDNGLVTPLKAGKVTITASSRDGSGKYATIEITIVGN